MISDKEIFDWLKSSSLCEDQFEPIERAVQNGSYLTLYQTMLGNWEWCIDKGFPIDRMECEKRANWIGLVWYWNGQLKERSEYKDRRHHVVVYEEWDEDMGSLHGISEQWYPYGQLKERAEYKYGLLHGVHELWHENGELRRRVES
jgi:antitoxin component YwqK of YwqJK toxin-antitoxin module